MKNLPLNRRLGIGSLAGDWWASVISGFIVLAAVMSEPGIREGKQIHADDTGDLTFTIEYTEGGDISNDCDDVAIEGQGEAAR